MTVGILLYALAGGALATVAGWGLAVVLRIACRPERWAWVVALALAATLCLVPLVPWRGAIGGGAAGPAFLLEDGPERTSVLTGAGSAPAVVSIGGNPIVAAIARALPIDPGARIPGGGRIWLGLSAAVFIVGLGAELRHARRAARLPRARLGELDVRFADREGPAILGAVRPRAVLPSRIDELGAADRAIVLAHETEHMRARDPQLNGLAFFAVAVAPWNPFLWILRRRLALAVEMDCDRRALGQPGVDPRRYVETLLRVASWQVARASIPLRLSMSRSARDLRHRVLRVLQPAPPRRVAAGAAGTLLVVGAAASLLANPPSPAPGRPAADRLVPEAAAMSLALGPPPTDPVGRAGMAAFAVETAEDGSVAGLRTEAMEGDETFERAARAWLSGARLEARPVPSPAPVRVWVAVDEGGAWAAARVADDLYARQGLEGDAARTLRVLRLWTRLASRPLGGWPPTVSFVTGPDLRSSAAGAAVSVGRRP